MSALAAAVADKVLLPSLVIEAHEDSHSHTVILLHGMAYDGSLYEALPRLMGARSSSVRFVFPCAPARTVSWPSGDEDVDGCWYNYYSSNGGTMQHDDIDVDDLERATAWKSTLHPLTSTRECLRMVS